MRVLFDNGTPRGVAAALLEHVVEEARSRGWDTLRNGELLDAAEAAAFDVFVTTDRNISLPAESQRSQDRDRGPWHRPLEADQAQAVGDRCHRDRSDAGQLRRG